jgi:hypothetical protein
LRSSQCSRQEQYTNDITGYNRGIHKNYLSKGMTNLACMGAGMEGTSIWIGFNEKGLVSREAEGIVGSKSGTYKS